MSNYKGQFKASKGWLEKFIFRFRYNFLEIKLIKKYSKSYRVYNNISS